MAPLISHDSRPWLRKVYDLSAAAPLIAWYAFGLFQLLPQLARQISLARLMIETDPSVLPPVLLLGILSKLCVH